LILPRWEDVGRIARLCSARFVPLFEVISVLVQGLLLGLPLKVD
jgi:hypothetical protein